MVLNCSKPSGKSSIIHARQNQFIQRNNFNNAPTSRIAIAMKKDVAFNEWHTEIPFWYQQVNLRRSKLLRGGQPAVDFDAADNCYLYVRKIKTMNFQGDIASIPINNYI